MMEITVLCEDTCLRQGLVGEVGLSILIDTEEGGILFDTGASGCVCHNADALKIDLGRIDKIVLSHSHPDHTGGLLRVLTRIQKEVDVIAHPDVWAAKYNEGKMGRSFMGIPFRREELFKHGARFCLSRDSLHIYETILTTGEIPMITEFEGSSRPLFGAEKRLIEENHIMRSDEMLDDQGLILKTYKGLVVVLGCSHRGIINSLNHAVQIGDEERIFAVFGGAHLVQESEERIKKTVDALKDMNIQMVALCHCTGFKALTYLSRELGGVFKYVGTGSRMKLPIH